MKQITQFFLEGESPNLRVNKFRIQFFRSLLYFSGPLSESSFIIVFSSSLTVIYLQIHCNIQTFTPVNYWLTSHFKGPGSHLGVPALRSHLFHLYAFRISLGIRHFPFCMEYNLLYENIIKDLKFHHNKTFTKSQKTISKAFRNQFYICINQTGTVR